ncbi:UNVERIFIED_CONTAM: hypothetical protein K2H54_056522 [Gekko kuhli]
MQFQGPDFEDKLYGMVWQKDPVDSGGSDQMGVMVAIAGPFRPKAAEFHEESSRAEYSGLPSRGGGLGLTPILVNSHVSLWLYPFLSLTVREAAGEGMPHAPNLALKLKADSKVWLSSASLNLQH